MEVNIVERFFGSLMKNSIGTFLLWYRGSSSGLSKATWKPVGNRLEIDWVAV